MMLGCRSAAIILASAVVVQAAPFTVSEQCTQGLALLQGRDEVELAARCRAAFSPKLCREAARSLGAQPWAPERMEASCNLLAADFVAANPESARSLEAAATGKNDLDKSAGGKEAPAAVPMPQVPVGGFLSSEAKAVADKSVSLEERKPAAEADADDAAVVEEKVDAGVPADAAEATKPVPKASGAGTKVAAVVNKAASAATAKPAVADAGKTVKAGAEAKVGAKAAEKAKSVVPAQGEKKVSSLTTRALEEEEEEEEEKEEKEEKEKEKEEEEKESPSSGKKAKELAKKEKAKGDDKSDEAEDEESKKDSDEEDGEDQTESDDVEEEERKKKDAGEEEESKKDSDGATSGLDNAVRLFGTRMHSSGDMASEKAGVLPHAAFLLVGVAAFSAILFGARRRQSGRGGTLPRLPEDASDAQLVE